MKKSPLYRDTFALCGVLQTTLEKGHQHAPLRRRLAEGALRLLDHVTLAIHGFDSSERLNLADAELCTLRIHLTLALELGVIDEESFLGFTEQADVVGRQIGGWLKKLHRELQQPS